MESGLVYNRREGWGGEEEEWLEVTGLFRSLLQEGMFPPSSYLLLLFPLPSSFFLLIAPSLSSSSLFFPPHSSSLLTLLLEKAIVGLGSQASLSGVVTNFDWYFVILPPPSF
jgi:hypothetical protein